MHFTKRVLQQAYQDGLVAADPTIHVRMPRRDSLDTDGKVTPKDVPTHAEAMTIIMAAPPRYRVGVVLGLGCGLRVGEVIALSPSRVDLAAGTITIDRQLQRRGLSSPKTWRGVRTIEVPDLVLLELHRAVKGVARDVPLLAGARGGTMRRDPFYAQVWRPALVAAGLTSDRFKFHAARHYVISSMLGRGVPVTDVARYVGDTPETIHRTYSHWLRDSASMAEAALDLALAPVPDERSDFATRQVRDKNEAKAPNNLPGRPLVGRRVGL